MSMLQHMCPKCDFYMPLVSTGTEGSSAIQYMRKCSNCGHNEEEKPGLVMETVIQEKAGSTYTAVLNEFTKMDPRLPHVKNIKCPNTECTTNLGTEEPDVIYMKTDAANLKFLYICNRCNTHWKSR